MLYDIAGSTAGDVAFASSEIQEEDVPSGGKPFFYSITRNRPLEFKLIFGANMYRVDVGEYLTKSDLARITKWLCRSEYKKLTIEQDDMREFFYRCVITDLTPVSVGGVAWALSATVRCDAPYAYRSRRMYRIDSSVGHGATKIEALHGHSDYYWPIMTVAPMEDGTIEITNITDEGRTLRLTDLSADVGIITIDNEKGIISSSNGANIYPCFNFSFLRLLQGDNLLKVTGACKVKIFCEYPAFIGA